MDQKGEVLFGIPVSKRCRFLVVAVAPARGVACRLDFRASGHFHPGAKLLSRGLDCVWEPGKTMGLKRGLSLRLSLEWETLSLEGNQGNMHHLSNAKDCPDIRRVPGKGPSNVGRAGFTPQVCSL